jgi:GLEYA domain
MSSTTFTSPQPPAPLVAGLLCRLYVGGNAGDNAASWFTDANTRGLTRFASTTSNTDSLAQATGGSAAKAGAGVAYSALWTGFFKAAQPRSVWIFTVRSDSPTYLWLGDAAASGYSATNALVSISGTALAAAGGAAVTASGTVTLPTSAALCYPMRIAYSRASGSGGAVLQVSFDGSPTLGAGALYGAGYYFSQPVLLSRVASPLNSAARCSMSWLLRAVNVQTGALYPVVYPDKAAALTLSQYHNSAPFAPSAPNLARLARVLKFASSTTLATDGAINDGASLYASYGSARNLVFFCRGAVYRLRFTSATAFALESTTDAGVTWARSAVPPAIGVPVTVVELVPTSAVTGGAASVTLPSLAQHTVAISTRFADGPGLGVEYLLADDPKRSAALSASGQLTISPDYRNASYAVTVTATSRLFTELTAAWVLTVTEPDIPALIAHPFTITFYAAGTATTRKSLVPLYFEDPSGYPIQSYTLLNENGTPATDKSWMTFDGDDLCVVGGYRGGYWFKVRANGVRGRSATLSALGSEEVMPDTLFVKLKDGVSLPTETNLVGTKTYDLADYFEDPLKDQGSSVTYTVISSMYNNAFVSGSVLSMSGNYRNTTYNIDIQATGRYSPVTNRKIASMSFTEPAGTPLTVVALSSLSLTNNTATVNLSTAFSDPLGKPITYTVLNAVYGNATISGSTLTIVGAYRSASYAVDVRASGDFNRVAVNSISVQEATPSALWNNGGADIPAITSLQGTVTLDLKNYFSDPLGQPIAFSVWGDPYACTSVSGSTLTIFGDFRNTTWGLEVRAAGAYNRLATRALSITEPAGTSTQGVQSEIRIVGQFPTNITLGYDATTLQLYSYIADSLGRRLWYKTTNPEGNAVVYNNGVLSAYAQPYLQVSGNCRGKTYTISVTAYRTSDMTEMSTLTSDSATLNLTVTEWPYVTLSLDGTWVRPASGDRASIAGSVGKWLNRARPDFTVTGNLQNYRVSPANNSSMTAPCEFKHPDDAWKYTSTAMYPTYYGARQIVHDSPKDEDNMWIREF